MMPPALTAVREHRGRNGGAFEHGSADLEAVFAGNGEHFRKGDLGADFSFQGFDLELVADANAVLLTASLDNSVHVE